MPDFNFRYNGVTGHRGNPEAAPENTLPSFESAIALGVDFLETDVHMTCDGVIVLCHDTTTGRTCDRDLVIADSTFAELAALDASAGFNRINRAAFPTTRIPRLSELLDLVRQHSDLRLSLQPKCDRVAAICAEVKQHGLERQIGFNDGNLRYMIEAKMLIREAAIFYDTYGDEQLDGALAEARKYGFFSIVSYHQNLNADRVGRIRAAGFEAGVWNIDDEADIRRFLEMGVTRIYSDHPARVFRIRKELGL